MKASEIVTAAMKSCGWSQEILAENAGYKTQSAISNRLNGKSMRVDTFVKLLSVMGYEVIVQSKSSNNNKNKWTVCDGLPSSELSSLLNKLSDVKGDVSTSGKRIKLTSTGEK